MERLECQERRKYCSRFFSLPRQKGLFTKLSRINALFFQPLRLAAARTLAGRRVVAKSGA
jgi:hypothetical protein